MNLPKLAVLGLLTTILTGAQEYDPNWQLKSPTDSWPGYHGDYSGRRHSPLTAITPLNVENLALAWSFQTGESGQLKCSPLMVNGILYITMPDHVWAVDARTGHELWHYRYPPKRASHWTSRRLDV